MSGSREIEDGETPKAESQVEPERLK